jgi:hypothetical protein
MEPLLNCDVLSFRNDNTSGCCNDSTQRNAAFQILGTALMQQSLTMALDDARKQYQLMFHASPLSMWVLDVETRQFLAANAT